MNGGVDVDAPTAGARRMPRRDAGAGAPLAYAVGRAIFRHLTLDVDERVLIPRPETEQLVDARARGDGGDAGRRRDRRRHRVGRDRAGARARGAVLARLRHRRLARTRSPSRDGTRRCVARCCVRRWSFVHGSLLAPAARRARACRRFQSTVHCAGRSAARCRRACATGSRRSRCSAASDGMAATARLVREAPSAGARRTARDGSRCAARVAGGGAGAVASGGFAPVRVSWISRDASASCSRDDRRRTG